MSDIKELNLILGDDGVLREYKGDYDITIHCETEAEADMVKQKLNQSNDLFDYIKAITDRAFLEVTYGRYDLSIDFLQIAPPSKILKDWREFRGIADDKKAD